jgi:hypothetical protein
LDTKLNFINASNDQNNSQIVIFQKNAAGPEPAVAWKVIRNCGPGSNHPFVYPEAMSVNVIDGHGNHTALQPAEDGMMLSLTLQPSGHVLAPAGSAGTGEVHVLNSLERGALTANLFRDGRLLAMRPWIYSGQRAMFKLRPTLWIGTMPQVEEGAVINSAILDSVTDEFPLFGATAIDIVMTGGGSGVDAPPLKFEFRNVSRRD